MPGGGVAVEDGRIVAVGPAARAGGRAPLLPGRRHRPRLRQRALAPRVRRLRRLRRRPLLPALDRPARHPEAPAPRRGRRRHRAPGRGRVPPLRDRHDRGRELHRRGRAGVRRARARRNRLPGGLRGRPGGRAGALRRAARGHVVVRLRPPCARRLPARAVHDLGRRLRGLRRPRRTRDDAPGRERGRAGLGAARHRHDDRCGGRPAGRAGRAFGHPHAGRARPPRPRAGRGALRLRGRGGDRAPGRARRGDRALPAVERDPRLRCGAPRRPSWRAAPGWASAPTAPPRRRRSTCSRR